MKVLIVDDSAAMRRTIRSVIEDLAEGIVECSSGTSALEHFQVFRPDWVLMDIKMPGVDGLTATREIKQRFPDARVVIVSSYDEQSLRDEADQAGACAYVSKDRLSQLVSLLRRDRSESDYLDG